MANKLEEIISGLLAVPGPEGSTLTGQGEALKGYATPITPKTDLGKIDVRKNFGKTGKGENKLAKNIGTGLAEFMQSLGHGMVGKPIDISGETQGSPSLGKRGWESYLGGAIGSKLGAGLIAGALGGGKAADQAAAGASPTYVDTQKNVFTELKGDDYLALQQELVKIPEETMANPQLAMPVYRAMLLKYPAAKSFLAEYFGLTRSYNYNYPQGLPGGKYNVGGPPVGAE